MAPRNLRRQCTVMVGNRRFIAGVVGWNLQHRPCLREQVFLAVVFFIYISKRLCTPTNRYLGHYCAYQLTFISVRRISQSIPARSGSCRHTPSAFRPRTEQLAFFRYNSRIAERRGKALPASTAAQRLAVAIDISVITIFARVLFFQFTRRPACGHISERR